MKWVVVSRSWPDGNHVIYCWVTPESMDYVRFASYTKRLTFANGRAGHASLARKLQRAQEVVLPARTRLCWLFGLLRRGGNGERAYIEGDRIVAASAEAALFCRVVARRLAGFAR